MGRPRKHKDDAAKQRAYRERLKARAAASPAFPRDAAPSDTIVDRVMRADAVAARAMGEA